MDSFNALLRDGEQITLKDGAILTASLCIFALIRLEVNDTETIAKILDFSNIPIIITSVKRSMFIMINLYLVDAFIDKLFDINNLLDKLLILIIGYSLLLFETFVLEENPNMFYFFLPFIYFCKLR